MEQPQSVAERVDHKTFSRARLEPLEQRTFLSAVVEADDDLVEVAAHSTPAAAGQQVEDSEAAPSQSRASAPQADNQQDDSAEESAPAEASGDEAEGSPVTPAPSGSNPNPSSTIDDLLTQNITLPQPTAWNTAAPVQNASALLKSELSEAGHLAVNVEAVTAFAAAAPVAAANQILTTGRQLALRVFSSVPILPVARAAAQLPVVAQAMAMIGPPVGTDQIGAEITHQSHKYLFAALGNPMSLLGDALARFTEESSRIASRPRSGDYRVRAWVVTAAVLTVDAVVLAWYRVQRRRRMSS